MLTNFDDKHVADNTALRIHVDGLEAYHQQIQGLDVWEISGTKINAIEEKPWGTTEFAVIDPAGVCISFYR